MTTEHGPQRQDGEQTPNTEQTDEARAAQEVGPYGGQSPYGEAPSGGRPTYDWEPAPSGEAPSRGRPTYGWEPAPPGQVPYTEQPGYAGPPSPSGGQPTHGEQPQYGQAPHGEQPQYGQAPHGQAAHGQAPHGQAAYGQGAHGQAPHAQAAYGQGAHGQAQYGGHVQQGEHPAYGGQPAYGAMPPPPPPPPAMWPGADVPGGHAYPAHAQPGKRRHRRGLAIAAGISALAIAGGGAALATSGGSSALTTGQIASQTDPGLVDVISTLGYAHGTAEGTGMVLTSNGEVLTNNHVVTGSTSIKVRDIGNGRTYTASVVGYSDSNDVAVLQLTGASGLTTVSIGNSDAATVGQKVVALGNAGGKDGTPSVASGQVTALGASVTAQDEGSGTVEQLSNMIQTNVNIQPGDSGGPLVNSAGQVIGMDTAASTGGSGGVGTTASETTTAFSIPINRAISIAQQIEAGHASTTVHIGATAFLGVELPTSASGFGQSGSGVTIEGVVAGTPAASAGLGGGDTILSLGGQQVASGSALQTLMQTYHPGDKVSISFSDPFGQTHTATITMMAGPTG
jgi:S1-C subfamily serine protease